MKDLKEEDTKDRRQESRLATCLHDIYHSRYFEVKECTGRFRARSKEFGGVSVTSFETNECIGFLLPVANGKKIKFFVRHHGINVSTIWALKDITLFGKY